MHSDEASLEGAGGAADWLTLGQAAAYLGVAQTTIRKWSDAGHVQAVRTPGGHRRYRRDALDAFVRRSAGVRPQDGPLVLVVDDDAGVRALLRSVFEAEGYRVRVADGAREGLAALAGERPDLVLLDVRMPEMDGWEMLKQLQRTHGTGLPVVMFSGEADEPPGSAASRGASGFVGKPFDPAHLLAQARRLLSP